MDYTPVHVRRVLTSFAITVLVALLPAAIGLVKSGVVARFLHDNGLTPGSGLALGLIAAVVVSSAVYFGRRLVRRPSRA
jgi:hypothetical protein